MSADLGKFIRQLRQALFFMMGTGKSVVFYFILNHFSFELQNRLHDFLRQKVQLGYHNYVCNEIN